MYSTPSRTILVLLVLGTPIEYTLTKSCNKNLHALPDWKRVRSPYYPSRFEPQTQCTWRITSPLTYRIQLEITDFSLVPPDHENKCVSQWLNVIEGGYVTDKDGTQPPMLTLCGTNKPRLVISTGNVLKLNLHSNSDAVNQPYRGFSAKYKYTDEEPFMPDISNELPTTDSPSYKGLSPSQRTMSGVSIGDIINPHIKPRPLPPNPNAVKTLQNRRTEAKNRAQNEEVSNNNNAQNNRRGSYPGERRRPPPGNGRPLVPNTLVIDDSNRISQTDLPPKRSKPLSSEVVILISVLGTVAAIGLMLYLLKRFVYDKRKNSGKGIHAYAHFRKFKKKGKSDENEKDTKINTIASTLPTENGTMNSKNSGFDSVDELKGLEKGFERDRGQEQNNRAKMQSTLNKDQAERELYGRKIAQERTKPDLEMINMPRPEAEGTSTSDDPSEDEYYRPVDRRYHRNDRDRGARPVRSQRRRDGDNIESKDRSNRGRGRPVDSLDDLGTKSRVDNRRNRSQKRDEAVSRRPRGERDRRHNRRSRSRTGGDEKRSTWRDRTYY